MQVEINSEINDTTFVQMSYVKVKFTLEQAMKAQWGRKGTALRFNLGARWGRVVNVTLRPLYSRERNLVPILHEAWWAPGPVWTGRPRENLAFRGCDPRTAHLVARRNFNLPRIYHPLTIYFRDY